MGSMKFELDLKGLSELMRSPEMQDVLDGVGAQVQGRAQSAARKPKAEYGRSIWIGNYAAVSQVRADNPEALHENLENNTLLKALG